MGEGLTPASLAMLFVGGLALFLYGIRLLSSGMKKASGESVRRLVSRITSNRLFGLLAGAAATMVVQSSSTIIATLVGLVQSQLMTFSQSLAIILGAEIGTTAMAQLIAFRLHDYALLFFAGGFALQLLARRDGLRYAGEALSGFGLLFFGLKVMADALAPLQGYEPFAVFLRLLDNPWLGLLAGLGLTALMQSSGAFIGIVMTLGAEGSLTLEAAIPLLLGANIGTCITALIAGVGMLRPARRVALAQIFFNVTGLLLLFFVIEWFAELVRAVSGGNGADVPRQIANAHSIYNIAMALLFLPFLGLFERLLVRLLPDDPEETRRVPAVWYLKESALDTPALALGFARAEVARMAKIAGRMVGAALYPFLREGPDRDAVFPSLSVAGGLAMREEKLDFLEGRISEYLIKIGKGELSEGESRELFALMRIVKELETMGDVIDTLARRIVPKSRHLKASLSGEGRGELVGLQEEACREVEAVEQMILSLDPLQARSVLDRETAYRRRVRLLEQAHMRRVGLHPQSELTHDLHMELLNAFGQIHHYCKRIAMAVAESSPEESG